MLMQRALEGSAHAEGPGRQCSCKGPWKALLKQRPLEGNAQAEGPGRQCSCRGPWKAMLNDMDLAGGRSGASKEELF
jgi:hypothetical protein